MLSHCCSQIIYTDCLRVIKWHSWFLLVWPEKKAGTAPRVAETSKWLQENSIARSLVTRLKDEMGISAEQIYALIRFTDFSPDAKARAGMMDGLRYLRICRKICG